MSDPCPDLDDVLSGEDPDWETEPVAPADEATVQRWLYRLARVGDEQAQIRARADLHREQVSTWERAALAPLEDQQRWLEASLAAFHRAVHARERAAGRKALTATIRFPTGTLASRAVPGGFKVQWEDPNEFMQWAKDHGYEALLRVKHEPDRREVAAQLQVLPDRPEGSLQFVYIDGQAVPGVTALIVDRTYRAEVEGT